MYITVVSCPGRKGEDSYTVGCCFNKVYCESERCAGHQHEGNKQGSFSRTRVALEHARPTAITQLANQGLLLLGLGLLLLGLGIGIRATRNLEFDILPRSRM